MTAKRVREIFGDKIADLTDSQVTEFISCMGVICDSLLDEMIYQLTLSKNSANTKDRVN